MTTSSRKAVWTGRVISVLATPLFLFSAFIKLKGGPELAQGFAHLGLPDSMAVPLAILYLREDRLKELIPLRTP
jgi:hypothetical protein